LILLQNLVEGNIRGKEGRESGEGKRLEDAKRRYQEDRRLSPRGKEGRKKDCGKQR
jgi:hypothetical protein